jgi:hypothetical protein
MVRKEMFISDAKRFVLDLADTSRLLNSTRLHRISYGKVRMRARGAVQVLVIFIPFLLTLICNRPILDNKEFVS